MKRLFVVEITMRAVVAADDETHAYQVAHDCRREIASEEQPDFDVCREVNAESDLPTGWDRGCFPYGPRDDLRISGYLSVSNEGDGQAKKKASEA